ncbi:hypothetical protein C5748_16675 [Phyllobacterium phragmitis]|uniref:Uncharacterized protein n=1 Tax=Phyllobacterium phragmitis TaxID=2670329 RepID=A0A2S9IPI0_9HYPH|nr:hypothetical protein C5748_16675 [Phyllobacterium phragmitis]
MQQSIGLLNGRVKWSTQHLTATVRGECRSRSDAAAFGSSPRITLEDFASVSFILARAAISMARYGAFPVRCS